MWVINAEGTDSDRSYKKNETEKKTEHTHTTLHPKKSVLKQEADVGHLR